MVSEMTSEITGRPIWYAEGR